MDKHVGCGITYLVGVHVKHLLQQSDARLVQAEPSREVLKREH